MLQHGAKISTISRSPPGSEEMNLQQPERPGILRAAHHAWKAGFAEQPPDNGSHDGAPMTMAASMRRCSEDLTFSSNDDPGWIDAKADGPIGEGRRHTVAVAVEVHE